VGLSIQPHKCLAWTSFGLPFGFIPLAEVCCPLDDIKILGVPCGYTSLAFSFLQKVLGEDVWHVDVFLKLGDVYVAFGIFSQCFTQRPSFLLCCFPPCKFLKLVCYF
jgi:hypothetical protein